MQLMDTVDTKKNLSCCFKSIYFYVQHGGIHPIQLKYLKYKENK